MKNWTFLLLRILVMFGPRTGWNDVRNMSAGRDFFLKIIKNKKYYNKKNENQVIVSYRTI